MKSKFILSIFFIFTVLSTFAQEGMWLLTQLGQLDMAKKGLMIPIEDIYSPDKPCLANAILQLGGGSASFVSPDGLIVTNHHVAYTALQRASSVANNYLTEESLKELEEGLTFTYNDYCEPVDKALLVRTLKMSAALPMGQRITGLEYILTGGNSGSPVMNAKGEIIGVAFDGNYEAMISDWKYDYALQRCIAVDIRYVLFITEKFGNAGFLLDEMGIKRLTDPACGKARVSFCKK